MLFRKAEWERVADGTITVAFRWQKRPTVKAGGTLQSAGGRLAIDAVEVADPATITEEDAHLAGYPDRGTLLDAIGPDPGEGRRLQRVAFHRAGDDPRVALRDADHLTDDDLAGLRTRLDRLDRASSHGPWTRQTLELIADHPAVVARELAALVGRERDPFKVDVRKLKGLGLTESLEVGYQISPRGQAFLDATSD